MNEIFWVIITSLGDPLLWSILVLALVGLYFVLRKRKVKGEGPRKMRRLLKKFLLIIIPTLLIVFLGSEFLKLAFQIPRVCIPCPGAGCNPYCPVTFAFPSGHTSTITGIVTAVFLLLRKRKHLLLYVLPVLVGVSRVALGVHTPTDVIGGFIFGFLATLVIWHGRKRLYKWEDEIL